MSQERAGAPMDTHINSSVSSPSCAVDDEQFCFELVYFKVENTIFTAIKQWLIVDGGIFADMFALPMSRLADGDSPGISIEGTTKDNPIVLEGATAGEFRSFLSILYQQGKPLTEYAQLVAALKLATRYNYLQARNDAIARLELLLGDIGPVARIILAREFLVAGWLKRGLTDLISNILNQVDLRPPTVTLRAPPYALDDRTISDVICICFEIRGLQKVPIKKRCDQCGEALHHRMAECKNCGRSTSVNVPTPDHEIQTRIEALFGVEIRECVYNAVNST